MADCFRFRVRDLPSRWRTSRPLACLIPQQGATVSIELTPAEDALAGETHDLQVVGTSETDSSITTSSPLAVTVVPRPREPDRLEPNNREASATELDFRDFTGDAATELDLGFHQHINAQVLGNGISRVQSSELSRATRRRLNLHRGNDGDFFRVKLPDPTEEGHPEFDGVPDAAM